MSWIILLFVIGILFIMAEVVVPGAILGIIGGLLMLAGCALTFLIYGSGSGMLALAAALVLGGSALFFEFKILPKTPLGRRAFLTREITAVSQAIGNEAQALVGQSAEAVTMLSPTGYVLVDGRRYEAFCQDGQAPAGAPLLVTGADAFRLIVKNRLTTHS